MIMDRHIVFIDGLINQFTHDQTASNCWYRMPTDGNVIWMIGSLLADTASSAIDEK